MAPDTASRTDTPDSPLTKRMHTYVSRLPGIAVCAVATAIAVWLSTLIPYVGAVLIAIIMGIVVRNVLPAIPAVLQPGIDFTSKTLLRLGIVFLGLRLVLGDVIGLGWGAIVVIIAVVAIGFTGTALLGRLLGVSSDLSLLIAAGFSICGAAAVAGAESTLKSKKEDTAAAVALVVLFGTSMILVVPVVTGLLSLDQHTAGMWAGASTHEVAQVAAIGGILGPEALKTATLVKLGRVVLLAPLMMALGVIVARARSGAGQDADTGKRPPLVPMWVIGFIIAAAIATTGVLPAWFESAAATAQSLLLTAAMFGLGCGVHIKSLLKLGLRPVALAALATCLVAGVAALGIWALT